MVQVPPDEFAVQFVFACASVPRDATIKFLGLGCCYDIYVIFLLRSLGNRLKYAPVFTFQFAL